MELLLNRRTVRGVTRYLVRWRGHASADDEWLRLEELAHCQEKVAEYDAAAPRGGIARRPGPAAGPAVSPVAAPVPAPLVAPAAFRLAVPAEVLTGAALIGQAVLYRWPAEGWVRGAVARRTRAAGFMRVVCYGRTSAFGLVASGDTLASRRGLARPGWAFGGSSSWCVSLASL